MKREQCYETDERRRRGTPAEKAAKLALLYAISENADDPVITPAAVEWGWRVVEHLTNRMLYQATVYVHDNEFDGDFGNRPLGILGTGP